LRAARRLAESGIPVTVLSLRDLPETTIELEAHFGAPLAEIFAATATGEARLLVADGGEVALEGRSQLVTEVATAALRAGLGVIAVTRADGAGAAERAPADASAAAGTMARVLKHEVPRLTAEEISQVTGACPSVR
jgi:hypothetical protein